MNKFCQKCNKEFVASHGLNKYCSNECRKVNRRHYNLQKRYSMSEDEWDKIFESQGKCCAICRTDTPTNEVYGWAVDHCHETGKIRGILCMKCNTGLGAFNDDTDIMIDAVTYILSYKNILSHVSGGR